ncbi:MAG TPA: class I SAM-dependent methyltransferase [Flavisolibacter sp.]|jgi:SAM-dependent methyltransferase|nr:class I SAM-dependent methyltransferase [Flavisolibacter sp.]
MQQAVNIERDHVDYEEWYHTERHSTHFNDDYYNARAEIAVKKFFTGVDLNSKILDFGCGLGQNIYKIPNAVGYDISEFGVEFCRRKGINATNHLTDLPNESFDIVFSSHVLEHHPHPKTMLEDIFSKLKKGGKFILVIPHETHGKAQFKFDLNQHLYTWNFQAINNLLLMNGFEILENKYVRGAGYNKLLPLAKTNFGLYRTATNLLSRLTGIKEMMIVTRKP